MPPPQVTEVVEEIQKILYSTADEPAAEALVPGGFSCNKKCTCWNMKFKNKKSASYERNAPRSTNSFLKIKPQNNEIT
jgi:hypothetical protein